MPGWRRLSVPQKIDALNEYCEDYSTYSSMAAQLNNADITGVTRNALVGFVRRVRPSITVKLLEKGTSGASGQRAPLKITKNPETKKRAAPCRSTTEKSCNPETAPPVIQEKKYKPVLFLNYRAGRHCNYPLWGEQRLIPVNEKFVCGAPPMPNSNYCRKHHDLCNPPDRNQKIRFRKKGDPDDGA